MKKLALILISIWFTLSLPSVVFAQVNLTQDDIESIYRGSEFYDPEAAGCEAYYGGGIQPNSLPQSTVDFYNEHIKSGVEALEEDYRAAAQILGVPWQLLAGIHWREGHNRPNSSLAAGEILGTTNPDHDTVMPSDRVENYVHVMEEITLPLAKGVYGYTITEDSTIDEIAYTMLAHNRGGAFNNVPEEEDGPWSYEMSPYVYSGITAATVRMAYPDRGYWPNIKKNPDPYDERWGNTSWGEIPSFRDRTDQTIGALAVYLLAGGPVNGASTGGLSADCNDGFIGGSGYITTDGYAFPLLVDSYNVSCTNEHPAPRPYEYQGCHHHYFAADLFKEPGTPVVAATAGTVISGGKGSRFDVAVCINSSNVTSGGYTLKYQVPKYTIKGDDGYRYYYTHMQPGSLVYGVGDHVEAGAPLGAIGPRECAQGTSPHLHFDIRLIDGYNPNDWYNEYFAPSSNSGAYYVDPYPLLKVWVKALPGS